MLRPNILLLTPSFKIPGGVSEFNKMIVQYSNVNITPFFLSSAGKSYSTVKSILLNLFDYVRLSYLLIFKKYNIVHVNPSLGKNSIVRDSVFVWISKLMYKKVFVHWHGWNPNNEYLLHSYKKFLQLTMFKADHIKFLASDFQNKFEAVGYKNTTSFGNTFIDDKLLSHKITKTNNGETVNILFLSTISKNKGIYEALETYQVLKEKYPFIKFTIAGTGQELEEVQNLVKKKQILDVKFKGYVKGIEKSKTYCEADIYFFPSHYEGMPTSVIEAMGFGVPVVCSNVGALLDFFIDGDMGFIVNGQEHNNYQIAIEKLICNKELRKTISAFNYKFTQENFLASETVAKIDMVYHNLTNV